MRITLGGIINLSKDRNGSKVILVILMKGFEKMKGVPEYLLPYAYDIKYGKESTSFFLKCTCGCSNFTMKLNDFNEHEKKIVEEYEAAFPKVGWHNIYSERGSDGKQHAYIRRFGFLKKEITFPVRPEFMDVKVLEASCVVCFKELIIFDSRFHGYDASCLEKDLSFYEPFFRDKILLPSSIKVKLYQDDDPEFDPVLFHDITVYKVVDGRSKTYFTCETS